MYKWSPLSACRDTSVNCIRTIFKKTYFAKNKFVTCIFSKATNFRVFISYTFNRYLYTYVCCYIHMYVVNFNLF